MSEERIFNDRIKTFKEWKKEMMDDSLADAQQERKRMNVEEFMLQVVIARGKKEIKLSMCDSTMKNWTEILLDEKQAAGLRKFLEENNWS